MFRPIFSQQETNYLHKTTVMLGITMNGEPCTFYQYYSVHLFRAIIYQASFSLCHIAPCSFLYNMLPSALLWPVSLLQQIEFVYFTYVHNLLFLCPHLRLHFLPTSSVSTCLVLNSSFCCITALSLFFAVSQIASWVAPDRFNFII